MKYLNYKNRDFFEEFISYIEQVTSDKLYNLYYYEIHISKPTKIKFYKSTISNEIISDCMYNITFKYKATKWYIPNIFAKILKTESLEFFILRSPFKFPKGDITIVNTNLGNALEELEYTIEQVFNFNIEEFKSEFQSWKCLSTTYKKELAQDEVICEWWDNL